jgi:hypothetical protein
MRGGGHGEAVSTQPTGTNAGKKGYIVSSHIAKMEQAWRQGNTP